MTKTYASSKSYHVIPIEIIGVFLQQICSCKPSFKVILEERICITTFWRVCCLSLIIATEMRKLTINNNYLYQLFMLCVYISQNSTFTVLIVHFNDNYSNRKWLLTLLDIFALSNKSNVHIYYVNLSNCVCKVMNSW